ncbi:MAG TPA: single-stranded-DNA-specific exonuclease RecJ [Solirubrobacteraceae bacterium]|jgi:single-stranded-DNA-specific exonuclease|nr:single-stranded-DNA-specific exonuclease RecJ [Solirubrobacteraceae bacterium]
MVHPRRLEIAPCPQLEVQRIARELDVSEPLAQVLVRRGLSDPVRARAFLDADERHPPAAFEGIEEALATILRHVRACARITVHGDYDVDGISSTAVLVRVLRALGADVDWYLPDRASDGYGLNAGTVRRLAARGTRLLITADCGITAVEEVALARALDIDVVVSDHHAPRADGALPRAPIVHPAVCGYPCPDLCATAVAYKLALALWEGAGRSLAPQPPCAGAGRRAPYRPDDDLDLVALATIADVVPLVGENRALARRGLRALAATAKPGLRALLAVARAGGRAGASIPDERTVAFALAPRLNAVGRMRRADAGLELLLTDDPERAQTVAAELDRANRERRDTETRILFDAERQLVAAGPRTGYVLAGEGWHPGVIGIVASRLAERHHRPFVLVALEGGSGRGSGRSIPGFDLLAALNGCAGHLVRHGGHRAAAGLELKRERLEAFGAAFAEHAERVLSPAALVPAERVDAIVGGGELGMALAEELRALAPFGSANPAVSLLVRDARFAERRAMGEGRHVRFTVLADGARAPAVAFGGGTTLPVRDGVPADASFTLEVNEWRGVTEPRLVLRHAQPACERTPAAPDEATLNPCPTPVPAQSHLFPPPAAETGTRKRLPALAETGMR